MLGLLFPGQGPQHPALLPWLDNDPAARPALAAMAAQIGADWRARLAEPAWAESNAVAQPLLTGIGIAAWACLAPRLPAPAVIAGLSVGELAAFCAAGVFDATAALAVAHDRAAAMADSDRANAAGQPTGLLAVSGAAAAVLADACGRFGLALALQLTTDRAVLGGPVAALEQAASALAAAGVQATGLAVRLASHTRWMAAAVPVLARRLDGLPMAPPRCVLVCNHTAAREHDADRLRAALAGQVAHTVRWDRCMDAVAERRPACVLEVGPGHTLAALWNERHPAIVARSVDEFRSPAAVAAWVRSALERR